MKIIMHKGYTDGDKVAFFLMGLLTCVLMLRDICSIPISKFVLLFICVVAFAVVSRNGICEILSFLIPLLCGMPSTYILLVALVFMLAYRKINLKSFCILFIIIFMELLFCVRAKSGFDSAVFKQIFFLCIFWIMLYDSDSLNYEKCLKMYFYGTLVLCFVIVVYSIITAPDNWTSLMSRGLYRFGDVAQNEVEDMILRLNANALAYFSLSGMLVGIVILFQEKSFSFFCGVFFLFISGALSFSHSWIIVTTGCFCLLILTQLNTPKKQIKVVLMILLAIFLGYCVCLKFPAIFDGFFTRITQADFTGGNGRIDILKNYIDKFFDSNILIFLFGTGSAHYMDVFQMEAAMHTGIAQIFLCYGIVGGTVFLVGMFLPFWHNLFFKLPFIYYLPLIGVLIFTQTIQFVNPPNLMLPFVLCLYSVKYGVNKVKKHID